jgi:hypothetical protein
MDTVNEQEKWLKCPDSERSPYGMWAWLYICHFFS